MSMTVREAISLGEKRLITSGITDAKRDARSLYCYLFGVPEDRLFMEYQYSLKELQWEQYFDLVDRRAGGEPLQYIVGTQEFMGLPFKVDRRVLIPRLDTEVLVEDALSVITKGVLRGERVLDFNSEQVADEHSSAPNINSLLHKPLMKGGSWDVLDLCCGSGAIGVSIAALACAWKSEKDVTDNDEAKQLKRENEDNNSENKKRGKISVALSDISQDACEVAHENVKLNKVDKTAKVFCGNLFEPFKRLFGTKKFDIIISNPPYIETDVIPMLQTEVKDHEPISALDGGKDGLDFYRKIIKAAPNYLKPGGIVMFEIGYNQGEALKTILEENGVFTNTRVHKDLAGLDRVIFSLYAK